MKAFLQLLLGIAEKPLIDYGSEGLDGWLEKQYAKNPKRTSMFVAIAHAGLKEEAEDIVAKTKTNIDDDVVAAAEKELEDFAARHNFKLADFLPAEDPK